MKQKKKTRVQPLVHRKWHKSLDLLKRGRKNGLILSTRYDIDVENESIIVTFVNKYANDRLTPDISPLKPASQAFPFAMIRKGKEKMW